MSASRFVHLHVHSEYSLLDGASRVKGLVGQAKSNKMSHLALTDHGVMHGCMDFYKKATAEGIQPILGMEAYVAPGSRFDKKGGKGDAGIDDLSDKTSYHLVLLAKDFEGYKNLMRIASIGHLEGFYYKPRVDHETLETYCEGIIALTACLKGEVPAAIIDEDMAKAKKLAEKYQRTFGEGNFFLEVQGNGLQEQDKVNQGMRELSKELSIPLVATADVHYLLQEDAKTQDCLICIGTKKIMSDPDRFKINTRDLYFKSEEEMKRSLPGYEDAVENTMLVAEQCHTELKYDGKTLHMPKFDIPREFENKEDYLRHLIYKGAEERYGEVTEEVKNRIEKELDLIFTQDFTGYFLIVWDYMKFAREQKISVGPGRGSAAGSAVAYCLYITDIEPLEFGLLFERFLNPERVNPPDIDTDFSDKRRDELIRYVQEKYGSDKVSQIVTFGTIGAKNAVRDVSRVLGLPASEGDRIAKMIPDGLGVTLEQALADVPELRRLREQDSVHEELFRHALKIEGMARQTSTHAAGVIIAPDELTKFTPLMRGADKENDVSTQYEMKNLEEIGLLKMDFLGLKNLSVIDGAVEIIRELYEPDFTITKIPYDDPKTFDLLCRGKTNGVFQFESTGMKELLRKAQPDEFTDIIALLALYRPGPLGSGMVDDFINRKKGLTDIIYDHPWLEPILNETYGIILYQEQVMQIANVIAGFSLGQADQMRRAMGKKKVDILNKMENDFYEGAKEKGVDINIAKRLWSLIYKFAGYGFNKSHSAAYAVISYRTAYLKANYPKAFMASILTTDMGDTNKVVKYCGDCKEMDIPVLPPDVNSSGVNFTVTKDGIRFGLAAIKGVGTNAVTTIIKEREKAGLYKSLDDFCERAKNGILSKSLIECLIYVGAFDSLGHTRATLLDVLPNAIERAQKMQKDKAVGQESLFGDFEEDDPAVDSIREELPELEKTELLKQEKLLLGYYFQGHPLDEFASELAMFVTDYAGHLFEKEELGQVRLAGIVSELKKKKIKSGDRMGLFSIEDQTGAVEVAVMPNLLEKKEEIIQEDEILVVEGEASQRGDTVSVRANEIMTVNEAWQRFVREMHITVPSDRLDDDQIMRVKGAILQASGSVKVVMHIRFPEIGAVGYELENPYLVTPSHELKTQIETMFETGCVTFKASSGFSNNGRRNGNGRNGNNRRYPQRR